jgi:hypothetical protein
MAVTTNAMKLKNMATPDETRELPKTKVEVVDLGDTTIMRGTFQPGWSWHECVKPKVGTQSCQVPHLNYVLSGRMHIRMDDGTEREMGPGEVASIPPGHDAWVVGDEPCVALDFLGGKVYGK